MSSFAQNATIVLVHGAWADGSCWQNVILPLREEGLRVMCAPIPLTSLGDDIAALEHALKRTSGPVLPAGHAYGAQAGPRDSRVRALVWRRRLPLRMRRLRMFFIAQSRIRRRRISSRMLMVLSGCPKAASPMRSHTTPHRTRSPFSKLCSGRSQ